MKSYCRIELMVLEYHYSPLYNLNPLFIPVCQLPTLTIYPPQKEKFYHPSLAETLKTFTKISSQIYLLAPSFWPHFTTKKNAIQVKNLSHILVTF